ncbi:MULTISPECIES: DUF4957 domain-containing protein [unclassified Flavobacterium]|uniref:DUF4957 domain-containing protein n=1 Tax=unclassified Flavobacterium TaxID=196869 RepID=UPI003F938C07
MKKIFIIKGLLATLLLTVLVSSCTGYSEDLLDVLDVNRVFSPIGLTAKVRNQTTVELNWTTRDNVDHYTVEFSADDPEFKTIFKTLQVAATELPIQVALEGETIYSIRVKAISSVGLEDSKWSVVTATTLSEQLLLATIDGDVQAKQATFRWAPNSSVTKIVLTPGNITHVITAQEKAAGIATVTSLTSETKYSAILYNNTKKRGFSSFETGIDIGTGILVKTTDDLFQKIAGAKAGDVLVLESGDFTSQTGSITLDKSITIRGLKSYNKPLLKVNFSIATGATDVSLIDLNLDGGKTLTDVVRFTDATSYGSLIISGCDIHDFDKSFIGSDVAAAKVNAVTVENTVVTNILTNGGDFIDFRKTFVAEVTLKNSTFNNCAPDRDFFRIDAGTLSGTGLTTKILVDSSTFYKVSNTSGKRFLYVRFNANTLTVRNSLFAETVAIYSNQTTTSDPSFVKNNYFNATGLHTTNTKFDNSTSFTTVNPGFENAAAGKFKISNQTLIDNKIGDPQWR